MYAKTEIYYMMRDKVIPSLINSEKIIKFEDIKEVLEKSSYWKKNNFAIINNSLSNNKNKNIIYRNKTQSNKRVKFSEKKLTKSNTEWKNLKNTRTSFFKDLFTINYHNYKTRNYNIKISHKSENRVPAKTFNTNKTEVNFCNPILKSFSNKMYKLHNKYSPFKTEREKNKNNIFHKDSIKYKNYLEFKNYKKIGRAHV